jgi:KaiC/GvpD/RAD55 family RecA-like ATPase
VEGVLADRQLSLIYGEPSSKKTFFAINLAMSVALGRPFFGRAVDQGGVVFVAAEASHGVLNRVAAHRKHHGMGESTIPMLIIPSSINLRETGYDIDRLVEAVAQANQTIQTNKWGNPVRLIILDTLSRILAGGNENGPEDMGMLVRNIDELRQRTNSHTSLVHHSGKDAAKGARGHSLLRAALDTELEVTVQGVVSVARVKKQREMPQEGEFAFRLQPVDLGTNDRGKTVTSCVVLPVEHRPELLPEKLPPSAQTALSALSDAINTGGEVPPSSPHIPPSVRAVTLGIWREYCFRRGISGADDLDSKDKAFKRAWRKLHQKSRIGVWDPWVWIVQ